MKVFLGREDEDEKSTKIGLYFASEFTLIKAEPVYIQEKWVFSVEKNPNPAFSTERKKELERLQSVAIQINLKLMGVEKWES